MSRSPVEDEKYLDAHDRAVDRANLTGLDVGLKWNRYAKDYLTMLLPAPDKRFGDELLCEVISPGTPKMGNQ